MDAKSKLVRVLVPVLCAVLFGWLFYHGGIALVQLVDLCTPAAHYLTVDSVEIIAYADRAGRVDVQWERTAARALIVDMHVELVARFNGRDKLWGATWPDQVFEQGSVVYVMSLHGVPPLPAGDYVVQGLVQVKLPSGVVKHVAFESPALRLQCGGDAGG